MPTIVNKLSVVHKGSNGVAVASAPDVCRTPTPGGPVPLPYTNVAFSKDLVNGSKTVFQDGNSIALKDSAFATSTGDEAGTLGGVVSGVNKGKAKFTNYSFDVKIEGRNVARFTDSMTMNGNGPNTIAVAESQANLAATLGEETKELLCKAFCWCDKGKDGPDIAPMQEVPEVFNLPSDGA